MMQRVENKIDKVMLDNKADKSDIKEKLKQKSKQDENKEHKQHSAKAGD